ncbi:MAG TPA: hypothetical protein VF796_29765, partial [Humisphaera sp.]
GPNTPQFGGDATAGQPLPGTPGSGTPDALPFGSQDPAARTPAPASAGTGGSNVPAFGPPPAGGTNAPRFGPAATDDRATAPASNAPKF